MMDFRCPYEVTPGQRCRRDIHRFGAHRFEREVELRIFRGELPWPESWPEDLQVLFFAGAFP